MFACAVTAMLALGIAVSTGRVAGAYAQGADVAVPHVTRPNVEIKSYPGELRCDGDSARLALRLTSADGNPAVGVPVGVWLWHGTIRVAGLGDSHDMQVAYSNSAGLVEVWLTPQPGGREWYDWEYRVNEIDLGESIGPFRRGACPFGPSDTSLGGRVWLDSNADGAMQSSERALPRIRFTLSGSNGSTRHLEIPGRRMYADARGFFKSPIPGWSYEIWRLCIDDERYRIVSVAGAVQVTNSCVVLELENVPSGLYTLNVGVMRSS